MSYSKLTKKNLRKLLSEARESPQSSTADSSNHNSGVRISREQRQSVVPVHSEFFSGRNF